MSEEYTYWRKCKHLDENPECTICLKERIEKLREALQRINDRGVSEYCKDTAIAETALYHDDELAK